MRKQDCYIALVLCLLFAIILNVSYAITMNKAEQQHSSSVDFIPITGHIYKVEEFEVRVYDDNNDYYEYETRYNITYKYEVNGKVYYTAEYDLTSKRETKSFYYNPNNPAEISAFANYADAVDWMSPLKIVGNFFEILTIILVFVSFYVTVVKKENNTTGGVVIQDDFDQFVRTDVVAVNQKIEESPSKREMETIAFTPKKKAEFQLYTEEEYQNL